MGAPPKIEMLKLFTLSTIHFTVATLSQKYHSTSSALTCLILGTIEIQEGCAWQCMCWYYTIFPRFIGVTTVAPMSLSVTFFSTHWRSSLEDDFFSLVMFNDIIIPSTDYLWCSGSLYNLCLNTFKTTQNYHMSSNSSYMPNQKCIVSLSEDIIYHHGPFLSGKKHSSANKFIQLEKIFKYIKDNLPLTCTRFFFDSSFTSSKHTQILIR